MTTPRRTGRQNNWDIIATHRSRLEGTFVDATFDEVNQWMGGGLPHSAGTYQAGWPASAPFGPPTDGSPSPTSNNNRSASGEAEVGLQRSQNRKAHHKGTVRICQVLLLH